MLPIDKDKSAVDALKKTQTLRASETQKKNGSHCLCTLPRP